MGNSVKKIGLFLSVLLATLTITISANGVLDIERDALMALYDTTNGDGWIRSDGWGFGNPCDPSWYGVTCESGHVDSLILHENQLSGSIPPELGNLSSLRVLYLAGNQLTSSIPPELGNLSNLQVLSLTYNQLTNSIPPELGSLSSLHELSLSENKLSGSIPSDLGNLLNLEALYLNHNELSGVIPAALRNLSDLRFLSLQANHGLTCWETIAALNWAKSLPNYYGPDFACIDFANVFYLPIVLLGDGGSPDVWPINVDELKKQTIAASDVHKWEFTAKQDDVVTISAAPSSNLDISLGINSPDGTPISNQDTGDAGQPETISEIKLGLSGTYQIVVSSLVNSTGDYALTLQNPFSKPFLVFRELLTYSSTGSGTLPEGIDHVWNFEGQAGERVTIRVMAVGDNDLILYLNGANGHELHFIDNGTGDGPPDDHEELVDYELPENGLYSIGVGEADFKPISYLITLQLES